MKTLDRLNLANNTLVIFSSDNGPILFDGYYDRSVEDLNGHQPTAGLRGWKYLTFEGGCRVPFIARWPQQIKPRVSDQLFSLVDIYATLAKIVGQKIPAHTAPDSLDLSAVLLGKTKKNVRDNTVLHGIGGLALRQGDWKYIPATAGAGGMGSGANAADERFAAANIPEPLLFNLATDPNETTNVIAQHPKKAKELAKLCHPGEDRGPEDSGAPRRTVRICPPCCWVKHTRIVRDHTVLHGIGGLAIRQGDWKYIPATAGAGGMGSGANAADRAIRGREHPRALAVQSRHRSERNDQRHRAASQKGQGAGQATGDH